MNVIETHTVTHIYQKIRLQEYAVSIFNSITTKSSLKKAIKKEIVLVNNQPTSTAYWVQKNDVITLLEDNTKKHKPFHLKLEIVYEDDYLAIINKPAGVLVSGNSFATIDNALEQNLRPSSQTDKTKPRPAHRLDYPTTGLLLVGKTRKAIELLNKLFEEKNITKEYVAITIGKMKPKGTLTTPIDQKPAVSKFEVLKSVPSKRFNYLNWVLLNPKTGRKHQLRRHLSLLKNPILGDKGYGLENLILLKKGLYLHAYSLEFIHPFTHKKLSLTKDPPKKFNTIFPNFKLTNSNH